MLRWFCGASLLLMPSSALAAPVEEEDRSRWLRQLDVQAGSAEADLKLRELDLREGVKVTLLPYHLRAHRIHLSLGRFGVRVSGDGVLTFCPCDDPPVAIGFTGGWAGPPDELIVENPTLRVLGVPIFWLPYLWLRTPRKIGLTTPEVSFRGADGLFLGQGVHVPIGAGLEASVGAYTAGGFASSIDFVTEKTATLIRFDARRGRDVGDKDVPSGIGLALDAHGEASVLRWDVDAIRGARGLRTTLDLDALARPFDRGAAEVHVGPAKIGLEVFSPRGSDLDAVGYAHPWVGLGGALPVDSIGGVDGWATFGPRWIAGRGAESIGDATLAAALGGPLGIATWSASTRVDGRIARTSVDDNAFSGDRGGAIVGEARLELSLPLAREIAIERAAGGPPVLHVIEPLVRGSVVGARSSGDLRALEGFVAAPAFAGVSTNAALVAVGTRTALGALAGGIAPGRDPWMGRLTGELSIGALAFDTHRDGSLAGSFAFSTRHADGGLASIALDGAATRPIDGRDPTIGWLALARTRWEWSRDGFGIELRGALRSEVPVLAGWALFGADLAPRLTTATGLDSKGATVGVGSGLPVFAGIRLAGGVDVFGENASDLGRSSGRLLEARGTLRYKHPCGCFRMAVRGGHVIGREGIDVFASFELAHDTTIEPRDF
ncbi:MAG: hypothetical protein ACXWVM_03050 [Polyangiales bacterium]